VVQGETFKGEPVVYCTQCGAPVAESAKFCRACGTNVAAGDAAGIVLESPPPLPSPKPAPSQLPPAPPAEPARYAGFWRRVAASILDGLVLAGLGFVLGVVAAFVAAGDISTEDGSMKFAAVYYLGSWIIGWLYFATMHSGERQASYGKRALGIKVTDDSGERISFGRASGRYFAYLLLTPLTLGIGLVMAGFTRRKQALHDLIAGTLVVSRETTPADVASGLQAPKVSGGVIALGVLAGMIPVVGILAAISIPAYNDYLIRSQVSEGLIMAAVVKASVAEAYANGQAFADMSTESLGLDPVPGKYVSAISVIGGTVTITYGGEANTALQSKSVLLVPGATAQGDVLWMCGHAATPDGIEDIALEDYADYTDVENKYLPSSCRE